MHRVKRLFATPRRAIVTVSILALIAAGSAYAAWLYTANGNGVARVASISSPTINAVPTVTGDLLPGQTTALQFNVTNPNSIPMTLTQVGGAFTMVAQTPATCPSTNFNLVTAATTNLTIVIPVGTTTISVPGAVSMLASAPQACSGQLVTATGATFSFST